MWDIIGHLRTTASLDRMVASGDVPHALLFTGPAGIGKTRLALELAKALNCTGEGRPCQVCLHCRQIEAGSHPDVSVIERPEGKTSIVIEQIRALREEASLRAFQGRTKVYVVAGAEAMTLQASDALLKTLEEPQPQVVIVLAAIDADSLPATVVSRCRVLPLQPVDAPTLAAALEAVDQDPAAAQRLARLSRGSVGWALKAVKQPKLVTQQEEMVSRLACLLDLGLDGRLQLAETMVADKKDRAVTRRNVELLMLVARDLLFLAQGLPPRLVSGDDRIALERQARRFSLADVHAYLIGLQTAMRRIDQNVDPRLSLEAVMVNVP